MKRTSISESGNDDSEELERLRARRRTENEADDEKLSDYMTMIIPDITAAKKDARENPGSDRKLSRHERAALIQQEMTKCRIEGSSRPIDETNQGFKMLQKFGYSGGGLGREGKGVEQPILVPERDPRVSVGIGVEAVLAAKVAAEAKRVEDMKVQQEQALKSFISSQASKHSSDKTLKMLRKAQGIIRNLDEREGVPAHELWGQDYEDDDNFDEEDR
jgi:hypothetical protein